MPVSHVLNQYLPMPVSHVLNQYLPGDCKVHLAVGTSYLDCHVARFDSKHMHHHKICYTLNAMTG
jgi:hypothetical protein